MEWIHFVQKEKYTENYLKEKESIPVCTWNAWRYVKKKFEVREDDILFVFESPFCGGTLSLPHSVKRMASPFEKHCVHVLMNTSEIDASWSFPVLKKYIHSQDQVCIFAFSFFDDTKNVQDWNKQYRRGQGFCYRENTDIFYRFGLKENQIHWVNYFEDTKKEIEEKIINSNIIFILGGAPDLMMERIRKFKLKSLLKNYQGLMIGYSAGAMIQLDTYHITPDEEYPNFAYLNGLGCLNGFDIEPHYRGSKVQKESIKKVRKEKNLPIYALYEDGGMIMDEKNLTFFGKVDRFED